MLRLSALLALVAQIAWAETVVATRAIRPNSILTAQDVRLDSGKVAGAFTSIEAVLGMEARVAIYPGRPIPLGALSEPALVERNQGVALVFARDGLRIVTEGRALGRGAAGDRIRVMNLASRSVLFGTVLPDGSIGVSQ